MSIAETLKQLPADYEVVIRSKTGTVDMVDRAGDLLRDDGTLLDLEDFDLISEIYLPGKMGSPVPAHLRPYQRGDIGGHIDPPSDAALRGPIGEWLTLVEPETEASLASLGAGLIAGLGAYMGRDITLRVGRITHTPNIFAIQVGPTGTARKGTADGEIRHFLTELDQGFAFDNIASGFGSGEALIERVADPQYNSKDEMVAGTDDQRLYIQEAEFSKLLRIADRQGSILSDVIRLAFDGNRPLANAAKTSRKLKSSRHCISLFGGITPDELIQIFPTLAAVSGTGNRYLWVWSDPDKLLPHGGREVAVSELANRVRMNITLARQHRELAYSPDGQKWWEANYAALRQVSEVSENVRPMVTRISDQTQRIALIYAASEGSKQVTAGHLEAAYAWVAHSIQTVGAVLGGLVRNEEAGRILASLRQHPGVPAQKTELYDLFARHTTATALDAALDELESAGLAYSWKASTDAGRPPIVVMATTPLEGGKKDFIRSHWVNETSEPSFAESSPNGRNSQLVTDETESERRGLARGGGYKSDPNANELSPDDLPDPF